MTAGCLCGREVPPRVGDVPRIGDVVGFAIEPTMRYGRVVGFLKLPQESPGAATTVVRQFRRGDGRWPTGGCCRAWLLIPWEHEHPVTVLPAAAETVELGQVPV